MAGTRTGDAGTPVKTPRRIAVFCVGNRLMLDDGIGGAVYDEIASSYDLPDNVALFDVGCMGLDMLPQVRDCDYLITVDALDATGAAPGTVFSFAPDEAARSGAAMRSLHEMRLADLFDAAVLLGYEAEGRCLGMQVGNMDPAELTVGLTPAVYAALPLLVDAVLAEMAGQGAVARIKASGRAVDEGWRHVMAPETQDDAWQHRR